MDEKISFFLPTRKGSQRVKNKNTRPFANIHGGILELKLLQLQKSNRLSEIVLSTNDPDSISIAKKLDSAGKRIKIIERPESLCLDTTSLTDLIKYVPTVIHNDHIIWGHTTTPFVNGADYDLGISEYFKQLEKGFDSLLSVCALQNFLLTKNGEIFNYDTSVERWPRTQDLPVLYEVNHAMFIAPRKTYIEKSNRIGEVPFLYQQSKIKSFDIDWEEDFIMAEALYDKIKNNGESFEEF